MEPTNPGLIIAAFVFVAVIIACDRIASVLLNKSRDEADVEKKKLEADSFKDMSDKLVQTISALNGTGLANNALKTIIDVDPSDGRSPNGRSTGYRDNGQPQHRVPVPNDFPGATATQGR